LTTLILLKLYAFLLPIVIWIAPKLGEKYLDKLFNKKSIYIDRCWVYKSNDGVKFDITLSSNFDHDISLHSFHARFENKNKAGIYGLGGGKKFLPLIKYLTKMVSLCLKLRTPFILIKLKPGLMKTKPIC
jgi:hypothetical protein